MNKLLNIGRKKIVTAVGRQLFPVFMNINVQTCRIKVTKMQVII